MNRSALLTILGSSALGFASKYKGSVSKVEKLDYKVIQLFKEYQVKSYPEEWDNPAPKIKKLLMTGKELGFPDDIDFITIESWFVDGTDPDQAEEQYSIERYAIDIHVYIKKDTLLDRIDPFITLENRERINNFVRKIEPRIMSIHRDLVLKSHPKESILKMPYYITDGDSSEEWHQPGWFETGFAYLPVEFGSRTNPYLQFYFCPIAPVILLNGKPIEFYKPPTKKTNLRRR